VEQVRVKVSCLEVGCILTKDVFGKTAYPIIPKNTTLSTLHLDILNAFQIEEVDVSKVKADGTTFKPLHIIEEEKTREEKNHILPDIDQLYTKAVKGYQNEYIKWQSGATVDITKIRSLIVPLLEVILDHSVQFQVLLSKSKMQDYLYHHAVSVGLISGLIAHKLYGDRGKTIQVALAGTLADCGMAKIDPQILLKETTLTHREFDEIKTHPVYSYKMIQYSPLLKNETKLAVLQHHERINGSGYPLGEKNEKIHQFSKIVAVADVYHALTSDRLFRKRVSPFKAIEIMLDDSFGQFDIFIIQTLIKLLHNFSTGTRIQLSNGQQGTVIFKKPQAPTRPIVKISSSDEIIDLEKTREIHIEQILD
jgi:HD-GYP domain-containing protein (c-di-GMP phosphodiesterase class II)